LITGDGLNETIVLIPTLNEAPGIGPTIKEIVKEVEDAEIIVVDSSSKDGTTQIAAELGAKVITQLGRGKGRAVAQGLRYMKNGAVWLVMVDGDNSYPAAYIPRMINILRERSDVGMVCGMPYLSYVEYYTLWKRIKWVYLYPIVFFNRVLVTLHRILNGVDMKAPLTGQRVIRYECIKDFQPKSKGFDLEVEINCQIRKKGYRILEIPIEVRLRLGKAKFYRFKHWLVIFRRIVIGCLS